MLSLLTHLINLIFPKVCAVCDKVLIKGEKVFCTHCILDIPKTHYHSIEENTLTQVFAGKFPIECAYAYFEFKKNSKFQTAILKLKYHGKQEIGYELGRLLALELKKISDFKADVLLPVPIHKSRLRQRGYNQSLIIAEGIKEINSIPIVDHAIIRKLATKTQTNKDRLSRWENMQDVFKIKKEALLRNKHIVIVDDIITTGATIESLANTILKIPNTKISVISIGYTDLN